MKTIKNLIELKRNVADFDRWFIDHPKDIPTLKIFYELLGVNRSFVKKIKQAMNKINDADIIDTSIDKSIDNSIDNSIDMSIDISKVVELYNNKVIELSLCSANYKCSNILIIDIYNILLDCSEKLRNEFWHRAINGEKKYLNPKLIEMYWNNFMEKKDKQDDIININIKLDKSEVSIKK